LDLLLKREPLYRLSYGRLNTKKYTTKYLKNKCRSLAALRLLI
jgi:hypothetical protein